MKTILKLDACVDFERDVSDKMMETFLDDFTDLVERYDAVTVAFCKQCSEEELE